MGDTQQQHHVCLYGGVVVFGYIWLLMIIAASKLDVSEKQTKDFCDKKVATGKFFFCQIITESESLLKQIKNCNVNLLEDIITDETP